MMSLSDFNSKQILFLITKNGETLSFKNDNVIVKDKDNKIIHQSTCYNLFAIFIIGHITITSGLIQRAKKFGFSIAFFTTTFRLYYVMSSTAEGNVILRQKQYNYDSLEAAKSLIMNKVSNQRTMLMHQRNKDKEISEAVALLDNYIIKLETADSIQSIMGYEGSASRAYFKAHFNNIVWHGRKPRIKYDMTNALLDIGYTMLFAYIDALLAIYGFDRYLGILHRQFYMRKSLVCDIIEPFRIIVDKQVKKGINLGQFKEKDFEIYDNKWCLKYEKSSEYIAVFMKEIVAYKQEIFIYVRDFYRSFMKEELNNSFPVWNMEE